MMDNTILAIILSSGIICEAQYNNCFMSGDSTGRSTRCGENLKDEENLKDVMEIMKRAKEFLENQSRMMLDPMSWIIKAPPPLLLISTPPPTNALAVPMSNSVIGVQFPTVKPNLQPLYVPLNSVGLPIGTNSFFTPTSRNSPDISSPQLAPFLGVIPGKMLKQNDQKVVFTTSKRHLPIAIENSEQINEHQEQLKSQESYLVNETHGMRNISKTPLESLPSIISMQEQNFNLQNSDDLEKISDEMPIILVLKRSKATAEYQ